MRVHLLGGECPVVHKEELDVSDVVDEESLVSGRHHVAGGFVRSVTNLQTQSTLTMYFDDIW